MSAPAELLDAAERETLLGLADVLVPATGTMPAASEADRSGKWLARALRARPDVTPVLQRVLNGARGRSPETKIARLQEADAEGFAALITIVMGAYFMNLKVRKLIGYPGQKPAPPYPDEADYYLADGLLDPVRTRGRRYRVVPE